MEYDKLVKILKRSLNNPSKSSIWAHMTSMACKYVCMCVRVSKWLPDMTCNIWICVTIYGNNIIINRHLKAYESLEYVCMYVYMSALRLQLGGDVSYVSRCHSALQWWMTLICHNDSIWAHAKHRQDAAKAVYVYIICMHVPLLKSLQRC